MVVKLCVDPGSVTILVDRLRTVDGVRAATEATLDVSTTVTETVVLAGDCELGASVTVWYTVSGESVVLAPPSTLTTE